MGETLARRRFDAFRQRGGTIADAELDDYWASLPPATVDGMLGEWKGGEFINGHRMNGQLEKSRWFGKTGISIGVPGICTEGQAVRCGAVIWSCSSASPCPEAISAAPKSDSLPGS